MLPPLLENLYASLFAEPAFSGRFVTDFLTRHPGKPAAKYKVMASANSSFDDLLKTLSRQELRSGAARMKLSLPQALQITSHAESLGAPTSVLRLALVHTYTSDLLAPWLQLEAALQGFNLQTYHAPYGVTFQEARPDSGLVAHQPDLCLVMLRREDLHPDLALPLARLDTNQQDILRAEVLKRLMDLMQRFRDQPVGQLVLTLLPSRQGPGLGAYDIQSGRSENHWWGHLKDEIGAAFRESLGATLFLDLDEVLLQLGRDQFFDLRYWYSSRYPFSALASRELVRRILALGAAIKFPKAKVIVLDADNTLWGGVIGEDGMTGIALGPDYPGNAFVDFQRRLLDFQQRGFLLALCSKNNPADLDQVLREHPHQILRDSHFAARRVNWEPKPDNLAALAKELNLGLDSFIFVDDSSFECAAVRHTLPQVEVIQTPTKPVDLPYCLEHVARLEVLSLTAEDLAKTQMYAQERQRREMLQGDQEGGGRNHLQSLEMNMTIRLDCPAHKARLSQLTQKTNQFNLTTRRYDEQQMQSFIQGNDWLVADFSLADVFGDSGVVGLAIFTLQGTAAVLDTFLMSCRVIGREAESAFLHRLLEILIARGIRTIRADFIPTAKNEPARSFLPQQGFSLCPDGRFELNLETHPHRPESAFPISVRLDV